MTASLFDSNLDSKVTLTNESTPLPEDMPFRLLIMGDWGGNSKFSATELSERRPIEIDRDEFDGVLRRISPSVSLKFQGAESNILNLTFESLDDFHPDNIFQQHPLFAELRRIRQNLMNAETFNEAAREVRSWYDESESISIDKNDYSSNTSNDLLENGNILDQILDNKSSNQSAAKSDLSTFVSNIIAPHIVKTDSEEQSKLLAIVDEVISDLMRKILHHSDFQELESAWRGLYFLVRKIETDNKLKIFIIQTTKEELLSNLCTGNNLADSEMFTLAVGDSLYDVEESPWAAICGNYSFSSTIDNTAALIRIAKIAETGNCPFISQIKPDIFGFDSFAEFPDQYNLKVSENSSDFKLWTALRAIPESVYLGLATPRFIGRFPYGHKTDPTETFSFEEFTDNYKHNDYLWINPCFAYAFALAKEFSINNWHINQNTAFDLEDLPLHLFQENGTTRTKPCAEIDMTEDAYNFILQQGLMTLISLRNSDKVRLSTLRSISMNSSFLKGKWLNVAVK